MKETKIEWADATWNPVTGCWHGCKYCYARSIARRFGGHWCAPLEANTTRTLMRPLGDLDVPLTITRKNGKETAAPYPYGFTPTIHRYKLDEPRRWKKPRTIFVCSMADLFGAWVPDEWIEDVFAACESAPQHRYLFLTKNPARYVDLYTKGILPTRDNYWYGSTCTGPDVPFYYSRMPDDNPHTFASIEPLLEPFGHSDAGAYTEWVIIGAETGSRKGKVTPEKKWVDEIVEQARRWRVPVFMKDSLLPVMGEENMLREFPWNGEEERVNGRL